MKGELILQMDPDGQYCSVYITGQDSKVRADIKVSRADMAQALSGLLTAELPPTLGGETKTQKKESSLEV